ncbi:hypothetical protein HK101_009705 [Irineochytrium annulatum]|nr:hypothetical protein HK101_009705 [Irineochytrium annulatum]
MSPKDGTKGFLRGEQYAVCLALVVDGKVELGVLGCPNLPLDLKRPDEGGRGSLFIACRGQGAFQRSLTTPNETRIYASSVQDPSKTFFCESVESGHSNQSASAKIATALGITQAPVRMDSQCKYGVVARGEAGIYLRIPVSETYEEKIWDHAGGSLLIEEAGGKISDYYGKPLDFSRGRTLKANKGIIASDASVYDKVLASVLATTKGNL